MANQFRDSTKSPYDNTYSTYYHLRSTSKGGSGVDIVGVEDITIPSVNFPDSETIGGSDYYVVQLEYNIDTTAIASTRPISVRNETESTDLIVTLGGDLSDALVANGCRIWGETSERRNLIQFYVDGTNISVGDTISIECYADSYCISDDRMNNIKAISLKTEQYIGTESDSDLIELSDNTVDVNGSVDITANLTATKLTADTVDCVSTGSGSNPIVDISTLIFGSTGTEFSTITFYVLKPCSFYYNWDGIATGTVYLRQDWINPETGSGSYLVASQAGSGSTKYNLLHLNPGRYILYADADKEDFEMGVFGAYGVNSTGTDSIKRQANADDNTVIMITGYSTS